MPHRSRPWSFRTLAALCLLAVAPLHGEPGVLPSLDPHKRIAQYVVDGWNQKDGLPSNQVLDILQTRDGYLWLATSGGLARFDGVRFQVFNMANTGALRSEAITALAEDTAGNLWIGSAGGGLLRYRGGRFTAYEVEDEPAARAVRALAIDRTGTLWVGSLGGLHRLAGGELQAVDDRALAGFAVRALAADGDGNLWIGTAGDGVYRYRDGRAEAVPLPAPQTSSVVLALHHDDEGGLWVATEGQGLSRLANGHVTLYGALPDELVSAVYQDRLGQMWVGTNGGVARYRDGRFETFGQADGLPDGRIRALFEDREGHLWIGTYAGGLARLKDGFITAFTPAQGLSGHHARSLYEDRRGRLWIGTVGTGLNVLEGGRITAFTPAAGFPSHGAVWSIAETHDGTLWIGTDDGLVRSPEGRFEAGAFTVYTTADGLSDNQVRVVLEDPYEPCTLWLGTIAGGVNRLRDGGFTHWGSGEGLADDDVRWLHVVGPGDLLIGTSRGLHRLRDGRVSRFAGALAGDMVVGGYEDAVGALWIGTLGAGLARLAGGDLTVFTTRDGMPSNDAWWILEDDFSDLWLSNDQGLQRVHRPDLEAYAAGRRAALAAESFGLADGMKAAECNGGGFPAGWKRADGTLWFPTMAGVVRVDPASQWRRVQPPPVIVEALYADGAPVDLGDGLELPANTGNLELHYTALSFRDPAQLRFRYRLEGYDRGWIDAGSRRIAYYTGLPPGRYVFKVVADDTGTESLRPAALRFVRRPRLYERNEVRAALVLLLGGLVTGGFHLGTRAIRRRNARLQAEIARRRRAEARLARAVADLEARNASLKERTAEMERFAFTLSHELKNPLLTIKVFLGRIRRTAAADDELAADLARIEAAAETMRRLLDAKLKYSRLEREHDPSARVPLAHLTREVAAERELAARGVTVEVAGSLPVVTGDARQLRLLLRELMDNAERFMGEQPAPRIEIGARSDAGATVCYLRDNGVGIEPRYRDKVFELFERLDADGEGDGVGLAVARRIAELHGGRMWIESAGRGQGTTVCFTLARAS